MNILFTNAGRRTYLIEYALDLIEEGYGLKLFVSDTSLDTAAMHVDPRLFQIITPRVSESEVNYFNALEFACKKYDIDVLIPLMDFELPILASRKNELEKLGVKVWVSNENTILNCLNKNHNYQFCIENDIPIPKTYFSLDGVKPPYVKKQILGSGSVGLELIREGHTSSFVPGIDMIQELVEGKEYGMDIMNDYHGNYLHSCVREKLAMRAGETDKARTFESEKLINLAKRVSAVFKHVGNMDIDFLQNDKGEIYFIDFNPRFGGGYPFTHLSGVNYLKFIIESSFGKNDYVPVFKKSITGFKGLRLFYKEN
jgi:carbamoyl-phosphate synthase large subunit